MSDDMDRIEPFMVYFNTRVRAMKSALLTRDQTEDLLTQGDVERLTEYLLNSPYGPEMAEALTRYDGADAVEEAVSRDLVDTYQRLLSFAQGDFRELAEIFLERWDLAAAKGVLRTKHHNLTPEQAMQDVPPGPTLTVPLIRDLVDRDSMQAVVAGLVAWNPRLARPLDRLMADYAETRNLALLEDALDRRYFTESVRRLKARGDDDARFLARVLQMEIDRINLRILFHLRTEEDQQRVEDRLLPQGMLSRDVLMRLAQADTAEEAAAVLVPTIYSDLSAELYQFVQTGRFSNLERLFERLLIAEIRKVARTHIFSIAILMLYAWLKYNEVLNLRLIARGLSRNLPQARVREELIYA